MREIDSTELHPILLDIAIAFHNVCVKNNIKYWMLGGTQLGAVRHNGFIPWDDDMDFGILSEDWDKLVTALDKDLPSVYKCRTRFNCTKFYGNTLKIEDTRTIINPDGNDLSEKGNIGINIDIFPLVFTDKNRVTSKSPCLNY